MSDAARFAAGATPGFFRQAAEWLSLAVAHLRVRLQLAGLEGREAALHYGIILALATGALVGLIFGYCFVCLAVVFLIAWACGGGNAWIWVLLGAGLLHVLGAAALLFWAKARLRTSMFAATLDELKKDQQWLNAATQKQP